MELKIKSCWQGSQNDMKKWLFFRFIRFVTQYLRDCLYLLLKLKQNGLPVLVSDAVTKELKILDSIRYLSLNDSIDVWAKIFFGLVEIPRSSELGNKRNVC